MLRANLMRKQDHLLGTNPVGIYICHELQSHLVNHAKPKLGDFYVFRFFGGQHDPRPVIVLQCLFTLFFYFIRFHIISPIEKFLEFLRNIF